VAWKFGSIEADQVLWKALSLKEEKLINLPDFLKECLFAILCPCFLYFHEVRYLDKIDLTQISLIYFEPF
jgi:hypothetical protein